MDKRQSVSGKAFGYAVIVFFTLVIFGGFHADLPARAAIVGPVGVSVPLSPDLSNEEALFARAAQFGSVRVIVGFDVGFQPEGALLLREQIENQRMAIDMAQDVVLNSLVSHDVRNVKRFSYIPYMAMEVDEAALDALWMNPDIVSIHEDVPLPPVLADSVPLIDADDVWNRVPQGFDGTGMAVAILDTGVRKSHEFLDDGKVVSEACYSSTYGDPYYSETVCPNGNESQTGTGAGVNCSTDWEGCSHGTHVAGIAAGTGGAGGIEGVAPGADIIAIQVFAKFPPSFCGSSSPCVLSWTSDQIQGLERVYALRDQFNIAAVNMSIGGGEYAAPCDDAPQAAIIGTLRSVGIATVIASGNNGFTDAMSSPACISAAISVGATEKDDDVAYFSNSASFLNLLAPGYSIYSSIADTKTSYDYYSGTSMAAPHVAGAFALLRQANFGATVNGIRNALEDTGVDVADYRNGRIKPRIDLDAALAQLGVVRPEITTPVPDSTISAGEVEFNWVSNGAAVDKWELWVGTSPGQDDVYNGPKVDSGITSATVSNIPLIGAPIYARLRFQISEKWWYIDFQYSTAIGTPSMVAPSPGGTLSDNMVTFEWDREGLAVDAWKLFVGTSQGARDLHDSGKLLPETDAHTVSGLPFDGSDIYVRLKYKVAGIWHSLDTQYTAVTWNIGITDPDPITESELTSRDVIFTWHDDTAPVQKWRLLIGSGVSMNDYYDSDKLVASVPQTTVEKLPKDGRTLYVRLKFKIHGIWEYADYQYTAVDALPKITSPEPGSTLNGYEVTFQWTPETYTVEKWKLYVGSAAGLNDYYDSTGLGAAVTQTTCSVMPTDGNKVYVRLRYKKNGIWKYRDYQYTAANKIPAITTPADGSELQSTSQEFVWQPNDAYIRNYKLWVGSSPGARDLYDSGKLPGTDTAHTVTGLPFDGSTIYVWLKYKSGISWKYADYQYTVKDTAPYITSPAPDSTFTHSTVTFEWQSGGVTVEKYRVYVGKTPGENNKYDSGNLLGDTLSCVAHQLPINGRQLYVRLRYKVAGVWYYRDYEYTAVTWNFGMTGPEPGSKLPDADESFDWAANGAPVDQWKLTVGISEGNSDIYNSGWQPTGTTTAFVSGIPMDGRKIYARLKARFYYDAENYDMYDRDYEYKTSFVSHRFYNSLVCGSTKFTAKVTISGESLTSTSGKWSSCGKTKSGTRKGTIYADAGACGIIQGSGYFDLELGCHYDWVLDFDGSDWEVWYLRTCPGDCGTPKPWSVSELLSEPDAAGSIKIIMRGPAEGDFKAIE